MSFQSSNQRSNSPHMSIGSVSTLRDRFEALNTPREGQGEPPSPPPRPIHHPSLRNPFPPPSPISPSHSPDPHSISPIPSPAHIPLRVRLAEMRARIARPLSTASTASDSTCSSRSRSPGSRSDSPYPSGTGADPRSHRNPNPIRSPTPLAMPLLGGGRHLHRRRDGSWRGGRCDSDDDSLGARLSSYLGDEDDILLDRLVNCALGGAGVGGSTSPGEEELAWPVSARSGGGSSPLRNSLVVDEDAATGEVRLESLGPEMERLLEQYVNKSDGEDADADDDGKSSISSSLSASKRNSLQIEYLQGRLDGAAETQESYVWVELPAIEEANSSVHEKDNDGASSGKSTPVEESIAYLFGRIDEELLNWSPIASPRNSISHQE
jgi:hypothetical protein